MRIALIITSVLCGAVASAIGFGWIDDATWQSDYPGWLAIAVTFFVAAHLPFERYERKP